MLSKALKTVSIRPKCLKSVVSDRNCMYCKGLIVIHGYLKSGTCRYKCKLCNKTFLQNYSNLACLLQTNIKITQLLKEGVGIRSTSRILKICTNTITDRILKIAESIHKPVAEAGQIYELDELRTYVGKKTNLKWIAYAMRRDTREVLDFNIGYRTNEMLRKVVHTILNADPRKVYTDRFLNYRYLIPPDIHSIKLYGINHVERNNLTIRTHLKRLGRRTICYSKSASVLAACMKIYFWG